MKDFVRKLTGKDGRMPEHCHPSAVEEINRFLRSAVSCPHKQEVPTEFKHNESKEIDSRKRARHFP